MANPTIRFMCGLTVACLLAASPTYATPPPRTPPAPLGAGTYATDALIAMPVQDMMRLLFADWGRDFVERRFDRSMIDLYTKPELGHAGVCSVRRLRFNLAIPSASTDGKAYVNGVSILQLYALVNTSAPFEPNLGASDDATRPFCAALPEGTRYFYAPSAKILAYQHNLIATAIAAAKTDRRLGFDLKCVPGGFKECSARKVLASLDPDDIRSIVYRDCENKQQCYEVRVGDWYLQIDSRWSTTGYTLVTPDLILTKISISSLPRLSGSYCPDC